MEVILLKDVEKLGRKGEAVSVRDGFGRNFLLPRAWAIPATSKNQARVEAEKKRLTARRAQEKEKAEQLAQKLQSVELRLPMPAGEKDKLFGSVTPQDISEALKSQGFILDKKKIHLAEPIRSLGKHAVTLELDQDVKAAVQVEVVKKAK